MKPRKPGFTILEILVASVCFLLMLSGLYGVYALGLRYLRMAQTQSQLQQQVSLAMLKVTQELSLSVDDPQSVQISTSPPSVWFLSSQDSPPGTAQFSYDASGNLQWQKYVCFYLTGQKLMRSELPAAGAPLILPFGPLSSPTLANFMASSGLLVADSLSSFSVVHQGNGVYHVQVVAALPGMDGASPCQTQLDTEVFLINSQ